MARTVPIINAEGIAKLQADHDRLAHEVAELRAILRTFQAMVTDGDYTPAKVDASGITAASGTTPGSGNAELHRMRADGTVVATGKDVTVHNWCGAIAANAYIGIGKDVFGRYWALTGRC